MIYKTQSIELRANNSNANRIENVKSTGNHILINLIPVKCVFGKAQSITIFDKHPLYTTLAPKFQGMTPIDGKITISGDAIPEELRMIEGGVTVTVPLEDKWCRVYTANIRNAQGTIIKRKGEIVTDQNGNPIVYTSIPVFAIRIQDQDSPTGYVWPLGEPETLAVGLLRSSYVKMVDAIQNNNISTAPIDDEELAQLAGGVVEQTPQAPQPAAAPTAAPVNPLGSGLV